MKKLIRLNQQDIHKIVKKVIKEQEEISLQERGMKSPTPGKFIYKKWRKRDGEIVVKAFIEYEYSFWTGRPGSEQDKIEVKKYLPLCGNADVGINQEIMFDNIFIPFKPIVGVNKESGDFHTGSPKEKCIPIEDVNYVSLSEYTPPSSPEKEDEDRWWENEITDEDETESPDIESIKLKVRKYLEKQDSSFAQMMNPTPKVQLQDNTITFIFYNKEGERDKIQGVVTDKEGNIINGYESK